MVMICRFVSTVCVCVSQNRKRQLADDYDALKVGGRTNEGVTTNRLQTGSFFSPSDVTSRSTDLNPVRGGGPQHGTAVEGRTVFPKSLCKKI